MTTLTWNDLWEIGTALNVRKNQIVQSMAVLSQYEDIVEMHQRELDKLTALEAKVDKARLEANDLY
jgi:hypothetical protein